MVIVNKLYPNIIIYKLITKFKQIEGQCKNSNKNQKIIDNIFYKELYDCLCKPTTNQKINTLIFKSQIRTYF